MKTTVKQRRDQTAMACDVALCVFAEAVLEDDRAPGLGVRRGPDVDGQTGGERDGAVG